MNGNNSAEKLYFSIKGKTQSLSYQVNWVYGLELSTDGLIIT